MAKQLTNILNGILGAGTNRRATALPAPRVSRERIWRVRPKTDLQASQRDRTLER